MAQELRKPQRPAVLPSIPVVVVLHSTPCSWESQPETKVTLDIASSGRRFRTQVNGFRSIESSKPQSAPYFDARLIRDEFLCIRTDEELLKFLNQVGSFVPAGTAEYWWALESLRACQQVFRDLLTHRPATWTRTVKLWSGWEQSDALDRALNNASNLPIKFRWSEKRSGATAQEQYGAMIEARDVVTAFLATIFIYHLRETKYRYCRRPDCGNVFEVGRRGKIYCEQYCGHLESLRATRKRKKQEQDTSTMTAYTGNQYRYLSDAITGCIAEV
jgi:hypothetical protein